MRRRAGAAASETRTYVAGVGTLSLGVGATGLVSYAYFSIASHTLASADYGRITLLWSAVFVTVSILYRPIEQLLARTIADREARGVGGRQHFRVAAQVELALALAFLALALGLRGPLEDGLFGGSEALYWTLVAAVAAYAWSYFARGVLAGRRRFRAYGGLLFLESCTRVMFALAVAVGIASGASVVALGMAAAPAVSLVVVAAVHALGERTTGGSFHALEQTRGSSGAEAVPVVAGAQPELTLAHGTSYAAAVLVVMACEQAFLNAGPVLVNATEPENGAAVAGLAFNALLIARAPLQLFQAVQAAILPHLARLWAGGRDVDFRTSVSLTLWAIAVFAAMVILALLAVGPGVMELLFGADFDYGRGGLALMGLGMGLYLGAATLTQAALARGQAALASLRWLAGAVTFVAVLVLPGADDRVLQIELAFASGAVVLFSTLYALHRRSHGAGPGPDRR